MNQREQFQAFMRRRNPKYGSTDDGVQDRLDWELWQAAQAELAPDSLRSLIEGVSVSVDVSTGEHDWANRYFGTVSEVMECQGGKLGVTLLVQDVMPNFTVDSKGG